MSRKRRRRPRRHSRHDTPPVQIYPKRNEPRPPQDNRTSIGDGQPLGGDGSQSGCEIRGDDRYLVAYRGDSQTLRELSEHRRDEVLARQKTRLEHARRPQKFIEGMVYLLGGGPRRDDLRLRLEADLARLDLRCQAFETAIDAILHIEHERSTQFQALCQALPYMRPEAHLIALRILDRLATGKVSLPNQPQPDTGNPGPSGGK